MQNQQFTDEEIAEKKEELMAFYKEQIEVLQLQKDYEALATDIEELRARRLIAQVRIAQMMAPSPEEKDMPEDLKASMEKMEKPARTLKKEK
jgi:hypothetical protein